MFTFTMVLTVLTAAVLGVWASRHRMINREKRFGHRLTPESPGPEGPRPKLSVLVAAKDEAENIEACLRTLLEQDYENFEVIACDDRSTDGTTEIIARLAAEDPRLKLVRVRELPEGWCGKNNAMRCGVEQAAGEWICMLDADCRQLSNRTLSAAVRYALDCDARMLSVLPILETRGFWERVVQPVCSGVMMIWFHPDKVNDPKRSNAYANGAFMMIRRDAYEAVGGHEAVRDKLNEDMHMARLVKLSGRRLRVVPSEGLYLVRMYTSLKAIYRGWSRIFFGTFGTPARLGASLAVMLLVSLLPYAAAATGLALAAAGVEPAAGWLAWGLAGSAAAAMQISVIWRFYGMLQVPRWAAPLYALGCLVAVACLLRAIGNLRRGAKVTWRDTAYAGLSQSASSPKD